MREYCALLVGGAVDCLCCVLLLAVGGVEVRFVVDL